MARISKKQKSKPRKVPKPNKSKASKKSKRPANAALTRQPVHQQIESLGPPSYLSDIAHDRFVRLQLMPTDGEEWRFICDVILAPGNKLLGTWPYFGLWAPMKREFVQECWPCIIESDGTINTGEQDDLYSSNLRQVDITVGARVVFRQSAERGRRQDNAYAFRIATIIELGQRPGQSQSPPSVVPSRETKVTT